jgi:hypothetical protein
MEDLSKVYEAVVEEKQHKDGEQTEERTSVVQGVDHGCDITGNLFMATKGLIKRQQPGRVELEIYKIGRGGVC